METLEELKLIIENAKDGDLFYDGRYLNKRLHVREVIDKHSIDGKQSHTFYSAPLYVNTDKLRSLSDIEQIIELKERVKKNYAAYCRIEAIKQEYNAENKQLKEVLKGVLEIFASVPDGFYRNELKAARKALGYKED